jgi:hypothetical protein
MLIHTKVKTRQFTERSVEEFKCLLNRESWQEVFNTLVINATLQVFMDTFVVILIQHKLVNLSV